MPKKRKRRKRVKKVTTIKDVYNPKQLDDMGSLNYSARPIGDIGDPFEKSESGTFTITEDIKPKKKKSFLPNGLIFGILKFAVQKLIIKVPEEKKEKIAKASSKFVIMLAKAVAEGAARGIAEGVKDNK